jgi:hypothetical protein
VETYSKILLLGGIKNCVKLVGQVYRSFSVRSHVMVKDEISWRLVNYVHAPLYCLLIKNTMKNVKPVSSGGMST